MSSAGRLRQHICDLKAVHPLILSTMTAQGRTGRELSSVYFIDFCHTADQTQHSSPFSLAFGQLPQSLNEALADLLC